MKMALAGTTLILVELSDEQYAEISSWKKMRWIRAKQRWEGFADIELLDRLAQLLDKEKLRLTDVVAKRREILHAVQDAVDRERVNEHPEPLVKYPVKMPLYAHQTRGANMALLTFGWAKEVGQ